MASSEQTYKKIMNSFFSPVDTNKFFLIWQSSTRSYTKLRILV